MPAKTKQFPLAPTQYKQLDMNSKPTYQELEKEIETLSQKLKVSENNEKVKLFFDENKAIMLQVNTKTKQIIDANKAAIDFYGYTKNELLQKTIDDLNTLSPDEINKLMEKAVKKKSNFFQFRHKLANGEIKDVEVFSSPAKLNNEISMIVTVYDISERKKIEQTLKESEEKFKGVIKSSPDGIGISDLDGIIQFTSPKTIEMWGYSYDEFIGKQIYEVIDEKSHGIVTNMINELLKGNNLGAIEYEMIRKDGSHFICEANCSLLYDKDNQPYSILYIQRDITDKKLAELELIKSEKLLKEANATKDKFFNIIAHDLKSPFNAIIGFSDLLLKNHTKYDNEKLEKLINPINKSAKSTFKLLENLLDWSRSQTGNLKFIPKEISLSVIFENIRNQTESVAKQKEINLQFEFNDNILIYADEYMVNTILRNLISNAIKFTNRNGKILLTVENIIDKIVISISDTGIGISEKNRLKIFDITEKTSTEGTENEQGTGLGLILCKEFIEKHNGKIWVESEEGNGTTFSFSIPKKN